MPIDPVEEFDPLKFPFIADEDNFHEYAEYVFEHLSSVVLPGWNAAIAQVNAKLPADLDTLTANLSGRYLRTVILTGAPGTYTPGLGCSRFRVRGCGAGGGGGGADGDTAETQGGCGGGGGAGAECEVWVTVGETVDYAYTLGGGGVGGAHNSSSGSSGGNTTFVSIGDGGAACSITLAGGGGGETGSDSNAAIASGGNGEIASVPGANAFPVILKEGDSGGVGWVITSADLAGDGLSVGGQGGASTFGEVEASRNTEGDGGSIAGFPADGFGVGGIGAAALGSATAVSGGDGGDGIIIIDEYA